MNMTEQNEQPDFTNEKDKAGEGEKPDLQDLWKQIFSETEIGKRITTAQVQSKLLDSINNNTNAINIFLVSIAALILFLVAAPLFVIAIAVAGWGQTIVGYSIFMLMGVLIYSIIVGEKRKSGKRNNG